jgi:hypothetical protein
MCVYTLSRSYLGTGASNRLLGNKTGQAGNVLEEKDEGHTDTINDGTTPLDPGFTVRSWGGERTGRIGVARKIYDL